MDKLVGHAIAETMTAVRDYVEQGSGAPRKLEPRVVHVLFADIVGFSKMSIEGQERAERRLREMVSSNEAFAESSLRGSMTCVDTGDGVALAFDDDPLAPLHVAVALCEHMAAESSFQLRIGLHSGPAVHTTDIAGHPNVKGVGMNVAERVMSAANPGQVLMTEHYASIARSFEGWSERIQPIGIRTVKHGLKLRLCELLTEGSHRRHALHERLATPLPPLNPIARWIGVTAMIAASATCIYLLVMTLLQAGTDAQGLRVSQMQSEAILKLRRPTNTRPAEAPPTRPVTELP